MLQELQQKNNKEKNLIETINIISQENATQKSQLSLLQHKIDKINHREVDFAST